MAKVKKIFPVLQMGCAACAARVENAVKETPGVVSAAVNFASANLSVEYDSAVVSPEELREAVRRAGYDLLVEGMRAFRPMPSMKSKKKSKRP